MSLAVKCKNSTEFFKSLNLSHFIPTMHYRAHNFLRLPNSENSMISAIPVVSFSAPNTGIYFVYFACMCDSDEPADN